MRKVPEIKLSIEEFLRTVEVGYYVEIELKAGAVVDVEGNRIEVTHPRLLRGIISSLTVPQSAQAEVERIRLGMSQYLLDVVSRSELLRAKAHHRPSLSVEIGPDGTASVNLCSLEVPKRFTEELH